MSSDSLATVNSDSAILSDSSANSSSEKSDGKQADFYQILGLTEDASYPEIKKKWLKLSMLFHPDKCGGDNEKYRQINLAYKVLSNPENRKKYNDSLAKTFNQLKEEDRDVKYHVNTTYMNGNKFDQDAFFNDFEKTRSAFQKDLIQPLSDQHLVRTTDTIPKVSKHDIHKLMEARSQQERELSNFQENLRSDTFNPSQNLDNFNFIFSQYHKLNNRTDIEEIVVDTDNNLSQYQDMNFFKQDAVDGNVLRQLSQTLLSRQAEHNVQEEEGVDQEAEEQLRLMLKEQEIQRTNMMLERLKADRLAMDSSIINYQVSLNESLLYTSDLDNTRSSHPKND